MVSRLTLRWIAVLASLPLADAAALPAQQPAMPGAVWIAAAPDSANASPATQNAPLPLFRKSFTLPEPPVSATLRIAGLGQYEARIDGRDVTSAVLTPGWTLYNKRVLYDTYDVTRLIHPGSNVLGVLLGNGMYRTFKSANRYSNIERSFGQPKLIAQLTIRFATHANLIISTGPEWLIHPGPITYSSAYGGEDFDARLEPANWDHPHFDSADWTAVTSVEGPGGVLEAESTPPVKAFETFRPVRMARRSSTVTVYDLGQNFAGWPEIQVLGPRGASVKLLCGELLTPSGEVTQRSANAFPGNPNLFTYTLRGGATAAQPERWHPRFSYYGFRYIQAEASPGVKILTVNGRFLHDAVRQVGTFTTSDPLLTSIHALIDRAMLSNMVSVLTDCPHREKLGWLEQTHLAGSALNFNWDLASLYRKISDDMADSQQPDGLIPSVAPDYPTFPGAFRDSPEWGSAVILSPWVAYQFSGDPSSLREHYESMQRYMAYLEGNAHDRLLDYGLGDWYDVGPGEPGVSKLTSLGLTASAIEYQDLVTLARIASLTDHPQDADSYSLKAQSVKEAFNRSFFHPAQGNYDRGSQTAQAMPLALGLVPEGRESDVLAALVASIRAAGNHVTAGDVGFHYVVRALTDAGRSDVLYDLFSRTDAPSYGAQLAAGATSLTEAWDANPKDSQNHFMLGHAEEWFYRGLAGIDFDRSREPGAVLRIAPAIVGTIQSASATLNSSLGTIRSAWHRPGIHAATLRVDLEIPRGMTTRFVIPPAYRGTVREAGRAFRADRRIQRNGSAAELVLLSGSYHLFLNRTQAPRTGASRSSPSASVQGVLPELVSPSITR